MAKRKVQLGCTCVVADPTTSKPEVRDSIGNIITPGTVGSRSIPAGEWVELDEDEADRLEARFPYRTYAAVRDAGVAAKTAEDAVGGRVMSVSKRG